MTKNQEQNIHFFMQEATKNGDLVSDATVYDLERDFAGLTYSKAEGLNTKGAIKNTYVEKYSDSDRLRVHFPETPTREATKVTLSFVIVGENRYATYDAFYEYIAGGFRAFWDNKRKRRLFFYCDAEYKPADEKWYGSTPYLTIDVEVNNIFGTTFPVEIEQTL